MVGKVFKNWRKVALEKNCKNQYFLIKLFVKVKNKVLMLGGGGWAGGGGTYFQFLTKNFNIFSKIPYNSKNSLFTICHIKNIVQENMVACYGYKARDKNSLVFVQKWLILKVVKIT